MYFYLQTALKGCEDTLFVDFIRRCLEWDPNTRLTPSAALRHPWLRRRLPRTPADKVNTKEDCCKFISDDRTEDGLNMACSQTKLIMDCN